MRYASAEARLEARRAQRRAYYQRHKQSVKDYNRLYNQRVRPAHKPARKATAWALHLKKRYGLTMEAYAALEREQGGRCFICGPNAKTTRKNARVLCVDHDHATGRVRRLICDRCNRLIGMADENVLVLRSAARYLDGYQRSGEWR